VKLSALRALSSISIINGFVIESEALNVEGFALNLKKKNEKWLIMMIIIFKNIINIIL
jgi:hypothetical protein